MVQTLINEFNKVYEVPYSVLFTFYILCYISFLLSDYIVREIIKK